ncbi:two-component system sensor histidine kinase NtrB [Parvularcula sp. LCG005]|uniref:two-component system sensor histidine kinase NtrB n=1 Tax=Parvularcula sp. LCG005 TaxID=3078805 RepID=UPI0029427BE0|nr:ATP-binding protein [Parvularcula sp. LCG005]WOI52801.1 ATP-binding protein [Parvularcula sp. LCG005]
MTSDMPDNPLVILNAIDRAGVGYAVTDLGGVIRSCSPTYRQHTALWADPNDDRPWFMRDPAPEETIAQRAALWRTFIEEAQRWQGMVRWHMPDGSIRYFEGTAVRAGDDQIVLVTNDRTDRVEARRSILEIQDRQRQIVTSLPVGVCLHADDGKILYTNDYLPHRIGLTADDCIGKSLQEACGDQVSNLFQQLVDDVRIKGAAVNGRIAEVTEGPLAGTHWLLFGKDISTRDGTRAGILTIAVDRTDSVRLREERSQFAEAIHQTQKIAALNDFAGNLAHELSNLLHPIGAYARMLTNNPDHENRQQFAAKINQGTLAAGRILRRTLAMAHTDRTELRLTDISETVEATIASAEDLAPTGLDYAYMDQRRAFMAYCQPGELRQVLLNLINNAAEAMHYRGTITITMADGLPRPYDLDLIPTGTEPFVRLSVSDQGPGITDTVRSRIFEPFFTTKPVGRGTGLGLAVVQGLVNGWGGVVSVDTRPGLGSTFHIWIPQGNMEE